MRELVHPRDIPIRDLPVKVDGQDVPFAFSFVKWFGDIVASDPAWGEGTNDEAAARLAALVRVQDAIEATEPGAAVQFDEDDFDVTSRIARKSQLAYQGPLAACNPKKARFLAALTSARKVKKEG